MSDASSLESAEIELAHRIPLPPSTSAVFMPSGTPSEGDSASSTRESNEGLPNESALPPTDSGLGAWSFLTAAFVVEAVVWGFPNAYGVFLDYPRYDSQQSATSLLPLVGTLSSGIIYCSGSLVNPIASRYPQHRRKSMWLGAVLTCGTLFGASYATKALYLPSSSSPRCRLWYRRMQALAQICPLLFSLHILALLYLPCISYMSEWFVARRGMASGILFAGTAVGGLLLPLVLPPLIAKYGSSKTLRILAIAIAILVLPLLPFVKGRLPETRVRIQGPALHGAPGHQDWMKKKSFLLFLTVNTLQAFAYFVPIVYLPSFANELHLSSSNSAVTLAMLNAASVIGRPSLGYLSDKLDPWVLAFLLLFTSSAMTFILWGVLSHTFAGLLTFGIVYGIIAGGWSSLWTGFVRPLAKDDPAMSTTFFGYILLSRGIGNILSTPISAKLYAHPHNVSEGVDRIGLDVGNGRLETMIIYVGMCFAGAAGVSALGWALDVRKRRQSGRGSE